MKKHTPLFWISLAVMPFWISACSDDDDMMEPVNGEATITIENVLDAKPLVQSGTFKNDGEAPVIMPGESISFQFYAAKGQAITFASMYGLSNDLFFAPANPGIMLYDEAGMPIEGDVSAQVKLWDNGTRVNEKPGPDTSHPGVAEASPNAVSEINGMDAQGNAYLAASELMKVSLQYDDNSMFTLTIENTSGNTINETAFSPGVWAISYIAGGDLLSPTPVYETDMPSANGLTALAEMGDNSELGAYLSEQTGIFTPLSPVLVMVYTGSENPIYKTGENDRGEGLKELAQMGDASKLANHLKTLPNVKEAYVLPAENSTVLLPVIGGQPGSKVSQRLNVAKGDRLAIATMYGLSNDWFFATKEDGVDATEKGDVSMSIGLFDNGTAVDQFPGAGLTQANLGGKPMDESEPIEAVPNPNAFTTLPAIEDIIKVSLN